MFLLSLLVSPSHPPTESPLRATAFPVRQEGQPALITQFEALWYQYFYSPCLDRFLMFPDQLKRDGGGFAER